MGLAEVERWLAETKRAVDTVRPCFDEGELSDVDRLIDQGEPLIGLSSLAHLIVQNRALVPRVVVDHIRGSLIGSSEEPFLPEDLGDYVSDDHQADIPLS
jgi:hypothetical protein